MEQFFRKRQRKIGKIEILHINPVAYLYLQILLPIL
jgi:hypothetical protein